MKPQAKPNTSPKPKKDYRCKDCEYWKEWGWVCTLTFKHAGDLAKKCKKFKLRKTDRKMSEVKYKLCPDCGEKMYMSSGGWQCSNCGMFESADGRTYASYQEYSDEPLKLKPSFDWQAFRAEAAKAVMVGLLAGRKTYPDREIVCENAVLYADELVKQLKDDN